jgi:hypothetical protein
MYGTTISRTVGVKALGWVVTLGLLVVGITSKGVLGGIGFYVISVLIAYVLYIILMAIIGGAFSDIFRILKKENIKVYSGEFASPLVAITLVLITSHLFHSLKYSHLMFTAFLVYMLVHVFLLFIDRKWTRMAYLWSTLALSEIVYIYAIFHH